jgi:SAM-dependent methyltransferase
LTIVSIEDLKEYVRKQYGNITANYNQRYEFMKKMIAEKKVSEILEAKIFPETEVLKKIMKEAKPKSGDKLLDIGCGTGIPVILLSKIIGPVGQAFAVDSSEAMIKQSIENARELGANVEFKKAEAQLLSFSDNYFDVVVSNCVVCLIPEKDRAISEIHRILKPRRKAVIADVYSKKVLPKRYRESPAIYSACIGGAIQLKEKIEIFKNNEFREIRIFDYGSIPEKWIEDWSKRFISCCRIDLSPIIREYMGFAIISASK